ncbi:MAG: hypothetical protein ABIE70_01275 [bacterium]
MRKIISVIMVLVLGVALVGSSAYAVNPDPNAVRPWICESRPDSGDDIGWDDPATSPPARGLVFRAFELNMPALMLNKIIFWFVVDWPSQPDDLDSTNDEAVKRDSRAYTE